MEFKVPVNADDLELNAQGRFCVETVFDVKSKEISAAVRGERIWSKVHVEASF